MNEYRVSQILDGTDFNMNKKRHIYKNSTYLCGYRTHYRPIFYLNDYSTNDICGILSIPICKTCLNKLPIKVKEEFIYNWTITKLKAK